MQDGIGQISERATLANWRTAPFSRRAYHHVREIVPTAEIAAKAAKKRLAWERRERAKAPPRNGK